MPATVGTEARPTAPAAELLFGRNAVLEALRGGRSIRRLLISSSAHGGPIDLLVQAARDRSVTVQRVDRQRLDALGARHQGVVAEAAPFRYVAIGDLIAAARDSGAPGLVLVLDSLQDPQNLGSLLRTAAALGAHGAVIPEHRAVAITPAVAKVSAGATERLPVARVVNLARALEELKGAGMWVIGLDSRATSTCSEADLIGPLALVVGGEGRGLRPLIRQACDFLVRIPMPGGVDSLNAAVAGSIVLYEVLRQRSIAK